MRTEAEINRGTHETEERALSRRGLLGGSTIAKAVAGAAGLTLASRALASAAAATGEPAFLVQVFLGGAADGLTVLCPFDDPDYATARTDTRLYGPGSPVDPNRIVIPLAGSLAGSTGSFGLPQALQPLEQIYTDGKLAMIHAVGNVMGVQSHFAARDQMEKGADGVSLPSDGWLARHLETKTDHLVGITRRFRAMAHLPIQSISLFGAPTATPVVDPANYALPDPLATGTTARFDTLDTAYASYGAPMEDAFLAMDEAISELDPLELVMNPATPSGVTYPTTPFGVQMRQAAQIGKHTNVEAVSLDLGAWDTHVKQGTYAGGPAGQYMHDLMGQLAGGLRAFYDDMIGESRKWIVLVISEFGRKVPENANLGTDHGKGGVAMMMGSDVDGGKLYGTSPGLDSTSLDDGDLAVTTDIRDVLHEVADKALLNPDPTGIFSSVGSYSAPVPSLGFML